MVTSPYATDEARRNISDPGNTERLERLIARTVLVDAEDERMHEGIKLPGKDVPILRGALNADPAIW